jgi:ankyrin repeat protein
VEQWPNAVEAKDNEGNLPLHIAVASHANTDVLRVLLGKEASGTVRQYLLDKGDEALQTRNAGGWLPLFIAVRYASVDIVRYLVDLRPAALLERDGDDRRLPIHIAAKSSSVAVVDFLLQQAPHTLDLGDREGWLPIHYAAWKGKLAVVKYLVGKSSDSLLAKEATKLIPLHIAVWSSAPDRERVVKFLIEEKEEALTIKDGIGDLPLHTAVRYAKLSVIKHLVEGREDDLLQQDKLGWLPLHLAAQYAPTDVVEYLLQKKPETRAKEDKIGQIPVKLAKDDEVKRVIESFDAMDLGRAPSPLTGANAIGEIPPASASPESANRAAQFSQLFTKKHEADPTRDFIICATGSELQLSLSCANDAPFS